MTAAIEPTSFIVVAVFVLTILGVAYGLKTRKGSGINEHPGPASPDPDPDGSEDPDGPSDPDGSEGDLPATERQETTVMDQHGTK